jgi:hypothetical protein
MPYPNGITTMNGLTVPGKEDCQDQVHAAEPVPRVLVGVGAVEQIDDGVAGLTIAVVAPAAYTR